MQAVRLYAMGDLRFEDVPRPPALQPGWVRVTVTHAGICGSDVHNFRTGQWISRSPSIAGHEFSGIVSETGFGADGLQPGDRVAGDSRFWCGTCQACLAGRRHLCEKLGFVGEVCDGCFAEEMVLPSRLLHKVPDNLPSRIAATAEPVAVALHAIRRLQPQRREPVLVIGCGPIGGFAAAVLKHEIAGPVIVADRNAARSATAAAATGATVAPAGQSELRSLLNRLGVRSAIDATGSITALQAAIGILPGGGRLAMVGISHGKLDFDPNLLVERELSLLGCHAFAGELPEAIAMLPDLAPMLDPMIGPEIALEDVPAAYQALIEGRAPGLKTLIRISA